MLAYLALCVTAYLVLKIGVAPRKADALGYLLVSGLIPLPVYIIGRSVNAGIFPIDVCLAAYIVVHGLPALDYAVDHRALSSGVVALFFLSVLATCSGVFNFIYLDPDPLRFYAFTVVKFWEYAFLSMVLINSRPDAAQLRKIFAIILAGILVYEIVHALHITGVVPLSGAEYYGQRAEGFEAKLDEYRTVPFSDRSAWFLTSTRQATGGTASINVWFSLMVFEAYRGTIKAVAAAAAVLAVFSVLATTSRSDIAGLAVAAIVFFIFAPPRRWKAYVCAALVAAALCGAYLVFFQPPNEETQAKNRITELWDPELRAAGSYVDRAADRTSLLSYLLGQRTKLLIGVGPGNFRWYRANGITKNGFGHNSYVQWTGELGIGGFLLVVAWCLWVCIYAMKRIRVQSRFCRLAARTCLALVVGRMISAWGNESLFGTDGMGYYSLYFLGVVYFLVSSASNVGSTGFFFHVRPNRYKRANSMVTGVMTTCEK